MKQTNLIQRLQAPSQCNVDAGKAVFVNPFSFGGGGGRFSKEALDLIMPICNFDYMGASEYEHGEVPLAFGQMGAYANTSGLFFNTLHIKRKDCKKLEFVSKQDVLRGWETCPVYIIGSKDDQPEIERRIRIIATNEDKACHGTGEGAKRKYDEGLRVRDSIQLQRFIQLEPRTDMPSVGWVELSNGFLFTVDETMATKFKALFMPEPKESDAEVSQPSAG